MPALIGVDAGVALVEGELCCRYRLRGDVARVRGLRGLASGRCDFLWKHTCFELFVAAEGSTAYREFNFSPSGQWATYDFGDYRQPLADPALPAPRMRMRPATEGFALEAVLPFSSLPAGGTAWEIGLAAVVEMDENGANEAGGSMSYWALRHLAARPDFHLRESFILRHPASAHGLESHSLL